jgi:hypothetical protein
LKGAGNEPKRDLRNEAVAIKVLDADVSGHTALYDWLLQHRTSDACAGENGGIYWYFSATMRALWSRIFILIATLSSRHFVFISTLPRSLAPRWRHFATISIERDACLTSRLFRPGAGKTFAEQKLEFPLKPTIAWRGWGALRRTSAEWSKAVESAAHAASHLNPSFLCTRLAAEVG